MLPLKQIYNTREQHMNSPKNSENECFFPSIKNKRVQTQGKQHKSLILKKWMRQNQYLSEILNQQSNGRKSKQKLPCSQVASRGLRANIALDNYLRNKHPSFDFSFKKIAKTEAFQNLQEEHQHIPQKYTKINLVFDQLANPQNTNPSFQNLINELKLINPIFQRITQIVSQTILKIGKIQKYDEGQCIYKKKSIIKEIGIVLWGQIILKNKNTKTKFHCLPGDSLNQQLIFQSLLYKLNRPLKIEKGTIHHVESAKAYCKTGVLYLSDEEYQLIYEEFAKIGQKDRILQLQNILKQSYLKKQRLRKETH